ncbi:hypothetical protein TrST_g11065 [Triparma strigata]|uniref:Cytoplasmic dynein 2 heavy chain 1 n=1 Tax=Triparma strigata TaxID=1606541 RepID=A0A9W7ELU0_9STRA|nr:hypothetical protein TrST_g11065 [Triparma strigata]
MPPSSDARTLYFTSTINANFGISEGDAELSDGNERAVNQFCDDESVTILSCLYSNSGSKISLTLTTSPPTVLPPSTSLLTFLKNPTSEPLSSLDPEDYSHNITVTSVPSGSSVLESFYSVVREVYGPALSENNNEEINDVLRKLNSTLKSAHSSSSTGDHNDTTAVKTPLDELNFWADFRGRSVPRGVVSDIRSNLEQIENVLTVLSPAKNGVANSTEGEENDDPNSLPLPSLPEMPSLLGDSGSLELALIQIYKLNDGEDSAVYSCSRMKHFLTTVGSSLCSYVRSQLPEGSKVFTQPYATVKTQMKSGREALKAFGSMAQKLTELEFRDSDHPWEGKPFSSSAIESLSTRLESISNIITTNEELKNLLPSSQRKGFSSAAQFAPFVAFGDVFLASKYTDGKWDQAKRHYEKSIAGVEAGVGADLKRKVSSLSGFNLLSTLRRYANVLRRPSVTKVMQPVLDSLEKNIVELLGDMEASVDNVNDDDKVNAIVVARQVASKGRSINSSSKEVGLGGEVRTACEDLVDKCSRFEKHTFNSWVEDAEDAGATVGLNEQLMDIKEGMLEVNYDEELVILLRQVRVLEEMGFKVPKDIKIRAEEGEKFYRFGIMLKKVSNFYNSLSHQIIPSQRSLLLSSLLAFEEIVTSQNEKDKVRWSDVKQVESCVERMHKAAERLKIENGKLRLIHSQLASQVSTLTNTQLLSSKSLWQSQWSSIQKIMSGLASSYDRKMMGKFVTFWNWQVYKAVEASYQMGLESLNESMGELKCDLVYTSHTTLRPPLESLRSKYYAKMRSFIAYPGGKFTGFAESDSGKKIFGGMAAANTDGLSRVYVKAEELFTTLRALVDKFSPYAILGSVDLASYVSQHCHTVHDYSANFTALKNKRKEAERLPDVERVDCVRVNLREFNATIGEQMQRMHDMLLVGLRNNIIKSFKPVDTFLADSLDALKSTPSTIEEITEAQGKWKEIESNKDSMREESRKSEEKLELLLTHATSSNAIDPSDLIAQMGNLDNSESSRWYNLEYELAAFSELIEKQKARAVDILEKDVEEMNASIDSFMNRWESLKPTEMKNWEKDTVDKVFAKLDNFWAEFEDLKNSANTLSTNCVNFGMSLPRFNSIEVAESDLKSTSESWNMLREYGDELDKMAQTDWITFRTNVFALEDFGKAWTEKLKERFADNAHDLVTIHLTEQLESIKRSMPAIKYCRGEPFKEDHWTELLQGKLRLPSNVRLENLTLGHFLMVLDRLEDPKMVQFVKHLQSRAQNEVMIREALQELVAWSQTTDLSLLDHELVTDDGIKKTMLIKDWKDLFLELGDKQSLLSSLKDSPFFKPFADTGATYETKLSNLDVYLHQLNTIQRKWLYLEPIFERGALPSEQQRFNRIDTEFRDIMQQVELEPKLFNLVDERIHHGLGNTLSTMVDQLERCQKALADFLEEKRSAMPRFYFIGDDDLLEILGQATNPAVIQTHLKKLFQGLYNVTFNEKQTSIIAFGSNAGEQVKLKKEIKLTNKVEEWLTSLEKEHKKTLSKLLTECLQQPVIDDYDAFPSQVLCLAENVKFSDRAEAAISDSSLGDLNDQLLDMLQQYTSFDLTDQPVMNLKIKSLVLDLIHNRDVVDQLKAARCRSYDDWIWQKQLRYYLDDKEMTIMRMSNAQFDYTYEYQGNAGKLVHTPLTDKCYLTLTQGMHFGFGGNPYGPAGTGKTESVKALGAAFGRQVLVFNCDEGIDFESMGRIFIGLVKSGAWGCFDEFNRLKEDQLSAISQQIQVIQDAIKEETRNIKLLGRNVSVDFNAGIFVTLNPAGKGYGGRSNLPDNLKALFRPIAMGRPDNELIAEVYLYSEGFVEGKTLGRKIVSLFNLSKQLLTSQQHYDWGLRALKAVLYTAGKLVSNKKSELGGKKLSKDDEAELLIKAIRVNTLSKLTYNDTISFLSLIGDIFVGVKSADVEGGELEKAIRQVMVEKPFLLSVEDSQVRKMLQLKEALDQRMGCVIVGPSGCGKTTLWSVLKAAMVKCGQPVITHVMNPKAMPRQQLLGSMDLDTREWKDGVLTDAARRAVKEPAEIKTWIVCDGDVDPEWIESLNSVLDDNHLLTMPNGERIAFGDNVNFLFETHDLSFASPATVSRMGMIFLNDDDVDVRRLVTRWLNTQEEGLRMNLSSWIDDLFFRALEYVLNQDMVVDTTMVGTVLSGLSQIQNCPSKKQFLCGVIRGLGGNLSLEDRKAFGKEVFTWGNERPPDLSNTIDCYFDGGGLASYQTQSVSFDNNAKIEESVVPTISVQRTLDMIQPWIEQFEPFILVGPEGCGKNMIIREAFRKQRSTQITVLHCNAQTTAEHVIMKIQQTCSLFSSPEGRVYRPRECERLVLYLKDINLPKPDMYNTCMLVAFLQQLLTFNGFYDENLEFLRIQKIQIVCSMNAATTVGRHPLSTRFTAVVRIGVVDYPDQKELSTVYDSILELAFSKPSAPRVPSKYSKDMERAKLASTMVDLYQQVKNKYTVDDHRHYLFTPRDLTSWVKNLLRYDLEGDELLDCLVYEAERQFRDRLVDGDAMQKFNSILAGILRSNWRHNANLEGCYFTALMNEQGGADSNGESKGGDDGDAGAGSGDAKLVRVKEDDFKGIVENGLMLFEREEKELNILLFGEIQDHIARVDRVLSQDGGHLLLVGRGGVGRRSSVTLACYMHHYKLATCNVTRDYGLPQFKNDLKAVMQLAGIEDEKVCFYLEDHQFTDDAILETVNSLLSAGEVPGLYSHEELEPLLAPLKELMLDEGGYKTPYDFFVARVKRNLHVCLSMDPSNKKFTVQCESNPAVYTSCNLLWMGEWSRASMRAVPLMLEGVRELVKGEGVDFDLGGEGEEGEEEESGGGGKSGGGEKSSKGEGKGSRKKAPKKKNFLSSVNPESVVDSIISIHTSCSTLGASPLDYMTFLNTWQSLFETKKKNLIAELGHLQGGLDKLAEASDTVDNLSNNAQKQQKQLKEAQTKADQAMDEITKALAGAQDTRRETEDLKKELAEKAAETAERKADIENELKDIQPVLEQAKEAVKGIKSENLNEIRSLKTPPAAISDVLSGVLMLLGIQDLSWLRMKKFLGQRGIKDEILNFDAKSITPAIMKSVANLLRSKANSFDAATIYRTSVAAAPLASWCKANVKFAMVLEKIQPLTNELAKAEQTLKKSQNRLDSCEAELAEIDEKVAALKADFGAKTREAETLRFGLETAQQTLEGAQRLLGQLGGEQGRWQNQADFLQGQISTLPSYMLLCAGFVVYLSKSSETVRENMLNGWVDIMSGIAKIDDFNLRKMLSTESGLLVWKSWGLPADKLSQENGIVVSNLRPEKVPFIIDPAEVSTAWLKQYLGKESKTGMEVVASGDPRFTSQVELCVRFGKTLLIMDVDGLDPMLYPLARRDLQHEGARWVVNVGDKVLDFAETFRMVLVTRNPNPSLPPDAAALVTEVNFTITKSGLEGQLLGVVLHVEQPELEKQKSEMLAQEEAYKVELAGLEKNLLEALSTAEGDLLQNVALIDTLTSTKEAASKIATALEESGKASEELDRQREVYRGFAKDGSKLFFLMSQLEAVNSMYQYSLASFIKLFEGVLSDPKNKNDDVKKRLGLLGTALEVSALYFVGRSLFKADRPMFALHMVHGMKNDIFEENEWEAFIGSLVSTDDKPNDFPSWAASERKRNFAVLSENFPRLIDSFDLGSNGWSRWASSAECELDFPSNLRGATAFEKVLLIQALRPDRMMSAINGFCCDELRVESLAPPAQTLESIWKGESSANVPIMLITTPGADPSKELEEFATQAVGKDRYKALAMGGGQQEIAMELLRSCARSGDWLCLKNLHLVVAWLGSLEKELNALEFHPDFRLWLTTEPHRKFPPILLQTSLKITYEAPPGIKKNMERTYAGWGDDFISDGGEKRSQLLFLLAFVHAVVQERRNFIPQGWTKMYEFSTGDLRAGTFALGGGDGGGDWETIHGLMMDSIYGGRVDNPFDQRVLKCYLDKYFNDKLIEGRGQIMKGVYVPSSNVAGDYHDSISKIPETDSPEIFSLPANIERSVQRARSAIVIEKLGMMSSAGLGSGGFDREEWKKSLGPLLQLWSKLMESNDDLDLAGRGRSPVKGDRGGDGGKGGKAAKDPVALFVGMEYEFALDLVSTVNSALTTLKKILYGSGLLTPDALKIAAELMRGAVPAVWEKKYEGDTKPTAYCSSIVAKTVALKRWKKRVRSGDLLKDPIDLSELFRAGTFLEAFRQQSARDQGVAMDSLVLESSWDARKGISGAVLPIMIEGLLLQGAVFNGDYLSEPAANAKEVVTAPPVTVAFVERDDGRGGRDRGNISVPIYMTLTREKFLTEVKIPCSDGEEGAWILSGCALMLQE